MAVRLTVRVDQGSESIFVDLWAYTNDVRLHFTRSSKATDHSYIEAFDGKLRAECLDAHWFMDLADARKQLEAWRRAYNEATPFAQPL